jgi:hypothetical protein
MQASFTRLYSGGSSGEVARSNSLRPKRRLVFASAEKLGRQRRLAHVHSFATLLKANGEDVNVVQESLRHVNSRISLNVDTQGLIPTKRFAQGRVENPIGTVAPCRVRLLFARLSRGK